MNGISSEEIEGDDLPPRRKTTLKCTQPETSVEIEEEETSILDLVSEKYLRTLV